MDLVIGSDATHDTGHSPLHNILLSKSDKPNIRRHKRSKKEKSRHYYESRSRSRSQTYSPSPYGYSRSYSHSPFDRTPSPERRHHRHRVPAYGRNSGYRSKSNSYTPPRYRPTHYRGGGTGLGNSSPTNRRRFYGDRELPQPSRVLGVFGLNIDTKEKEVKDVFRRFGPMEKVVIVYDHQTGRSRGFAFVYFEDVADAEDAKETMNGFDMQGRKIRVDFSITKRPHTPTPGIYMGKPSSSTKRRSERERERERYTSGYDGYDRESRYPRSRSGFYKSRSRSYSPRYHPHDRGYY
ncbi:Transformer-2 protein-like protein alpha-like [Oopsacas minuta]|uniref:Transformer-2 protein-like protein alpha-like n=1 Tax=Oopsacas minuta TaxID=111878 RepID=A0AAV7KMM1_9METZ|nr:Transformer-2 protein-like protein alpha-like [Oopsacas minuta]